MNGSPLCCPRCGDLFTASGPEGQTAPCPACGAEVRFPVGRFAGIVSVVSFVAALPPGRRQALQAGLHPDEPPRDEAPTTADLAWANNWLIHHEITASPYWRRCLVLATHLLSGTEESIDQQQVFAVARDIAQQSGGNQSFAPRQY